MDPKKNHMRGHASLKDLEDLENKCDFKIKEGGWNVGGER